RRGGPCRPSRLARAWASRNPAAPPTGVRGKRVPRRVGCGAMSHVTTADRDGVKVLTVDRPPANAMDVELLDELGQAIDPLAAEPPKALVLAGRDGYFSAGVDLKAVPGYGADEQRKMVEGINRLALGVYALPCPVVCAITGHAIAGGFVLALC